MSRTSVRQAVTDFLSGQVPGLGTVFPHPPKTTTQDALFLDGPATSGAVAYVVLERQHEQRVAIPAGKGRKWRQYQVCLLIFLRGTTGQAEDADADLDTLLDALAARLQSDPALGTAGNVIPDTPSAASGTVIFQAGEGGDHGGPDIEIATGIPADLKNGLTQIIATVRFQVAEILIT